MPLTDALLLDPAPFNVWIAARTDGIKGCGTSPGDPFNGKGSVPHISIFFGVDGQNGVPQRDFVARKLRVEYPTAYATRCLRQAR